MGKAVAFCQNNLELRIGMPHANVRGLREILRGERSVARDFADQMAVAVMRSKDRRSRLRISRARNVGVGGIRDARIHDFVTRSSRR